MTKFFRSPLEILAIFVGIGGVLLLLYAWHLPPFDSSVETTDNAYVKGYVTMISPQISGYVTKVAVKDYEDVKEGQLLATIDDSIYSQRVDQGRATLDGQKAALDNSRQQEASARANITASDAQIDSVSAGQHRAELASARIENLVTKGISTTSDSETALATLEQARASVNQAKAALEVSKQALTTIIVNRGSLEAAVSGAEAAVHLAEIDLRHANITAVAAGRVGEVGVRVGQYVTAGTQLMALVPRDVWVIANFKETQLEGMKPGQPVAVSVDALGHATMRGRIKSFSPAAGSEFAVIKPDNATGNFTKVAQRVGVRVDLDPGQPMEAVLSPGLSVIVSIDTNSKPEQAVASN
jgi:multidrug resistance efflux pump